MPESPSSSPLADNAPAAAVRRLMREAWRATLATTLTDARGAWPYASLVLTASDVDLAPLLLLSELAAHTRNLRADPRCAILFDGTQGLAEPLTGPRVTVLGAAEPVQDPRALGRYLRRHPAAAAYAGFADFRLWRFTPERGQIVAGFGRITWVEAEAIRPDPEAARRIAADEPALVEALNGQGAPLIERLAGRPGWRLAGLDAEGADLIGPDGSLERVWFPDPAHDGEAARRALKQLAAG